MTLRAPVGANKSNVLEVSSAETYNSTVQLKMVAWGIDVNQYFPRTTAAAVTIAVTVQYIQLSRPM